MSVSKSPDAFRTISEVADDLGVPQHVLRFWESKFSQVKPLKRGGGRRYYRPNDVDLLKGIQHLLHEEGYTIRGVQKVFRKEGVRFVTAIGRGGELDRGVVAETVPAAEPIEQASAEPQQLSLVPSARIALSADEHAALTSRLDTLMSLKTHLRATLEAREERLEKTSGQRAAKPRAASA